MAWRVEAGDCLELLAALPENSFDALCTDPPGALRFMGMEWDSDRGGRTQWVAWMEARMRAVLRVLKPGAHGVVWALPRTSHWTATALEDAGFEVRDCLTHLFGSGFPKSLSVGAAIDKAAGAEREVIGQRVVSKDLARKGRRGDMHVLGHAQSATLTVTAPATDAAKQWEGYGTALKPSAEFYWLVRKPLSEPNVAANILRWGTGGLNIDASRIHTPGSEAKSYSVTRLKPGATLNATGGNWRPENGGRQYEGQTKAGRWPTNTLFSHEPECGETCVEGCAVALLDAQSGHLKSGKPGNARRHANGFNGRHHGNETPLTGIGDEGGASRFFPTFRYCAKPSRSEKEAGLEALEDRTFHRVNPGGLEHDPRWAPQRRKNDHATVKPIALMQWLITLICPEGGQVLDPFLGSGTTGAAAAALGFGFYGCDLSPEYVEIAQARIAHWERVK